MKAKPFAPGNVVAIRHGAWSPSAVDPVAAELVGAVLADPAVDYLTEPRYRAELEAWARSEAMAALLRDWLSDQGGLFDDQGDERAAVRTLDRAESRAASGRDRLGLNPAAAARLRRDVAVTHAAQVSVVNRLRDDGHTIAVERGLIDGEA